MLSERISALFSLLQCSNTDVARFAGCSPSNVSRLKSGSRGASPDSRSLLRVARGAYRYAEAEALVPVLCALCGVEDGGEESVVRALAAWLCAEGEIVLPRAAAPRSRKRSETRRERFGARLTRMMELLKLTNARLALWLNVDMSLVSRWRSGAHSPHGNPAMEERLAGALLRQAERSGKVAKLAALCGVEGGALDADAFAAWLMGAADESPAALARMLLRSMDSLSPSPLPEAQEPPALRVAERYWGAAGLRDAVARFLSDAAREGGELLLYSDEPMDWLSGEKAYFALWAQLMLACVANGVRIRIIHNLDRDAREMVAAIGGWFPLYTSGMIEPYVLHRAKSERFCHTIFLRPGGACIIGFFPASAGEERWYDYVTDEQRLAAAAREYDALLRGASPFLRTYSPARAEAYREFLAQRAEPHAYLLSELPVLTMPEELLARMLARSPEPPARREAVLSYYRTRRERFFAALRGGVSILLFTPDAPDEKHYVNFSADFIDLTLAYEPEEYAAHVAATAELLAREENFRLSTLSVPSFRDLQIAALHDAVAVLRRRPPHAAFVSTNALLTQSMADYFAALEKLKTEEGAKGDCAAEIFPL